jgi:hypothetical protein
MHVYETVHQKPDTKIRFKSIRFGKLDVTWNFRSVAVGWGTVPQAGRSRIRIAMTSLYVFNVPNPTNRTVTLGLTQRLTEMGTGSFLSGGVTGGRSVSLTSPPSVSRLSRCGKCGIIDVSQSYSAPRLALPLIPFFTIMTPFYVSRRLWQTKSSAADQKTNKLRGP